MAIIETEQDWWNLVDYQWDNLLVMAGDQLDLNHDAYEDPGNPESKMTGRRVLEEMVYLKKQKDPKLARYFNAIWGLASDSYAYSVPGWSDLCDLCSEEWALYESEGENA